MEHLWVDFTRYGYATTLRAWVLVEQRLGLAVGMHVLVDGDAVAPREAVILEFSPDRSEAAVQLV